MAPILVYTADEAWENLPARQVASVHIAEFPSPSKTRMPSSPGTQASPPASTSNMDNVDAPESGAVPAWERIFAIRDEVLKALETARNDKQIGSSLEAKVVLTVDHDTARFLLDYFDQLRYIFIVSQVEVHEGDKFSVTITRADGEKCERCWNYSTRVGESSRFPTVCERCDEALNEIMG
jgi:isoleucyl-tRNA synthetase